MRVQIQELEALVSSLRDKLHHATDASKTAHQSSKDHIVSISKQKRLTEDFGRIHLHQSESSYVESDHWTAIFDGIAELKDCVENSEATTSSPNVPDTDGVPGPDLFFATTKPTSKLEILAAIPPRLVVDSMVARYFATMDIPFSLILHRHVFFKQYESFWENQLDTPVMWIAVLFGIMHFVAFTQCFADGGLNTLDERTTIEYRQIIGTSREKLVDCLRMGNWIKGTPFTIEALLLYFQVEYVRRDDSRTGYWMVLGNAVRVAFKMGYHRDGSHFPQMRAFEAEMRRRTWSLLAQLDSLSSAAVGLPRMIKEAQCDTVEPHNLPDDDFDDTTSVLPPPRPQSEHTLAQFLVYKSRLVATIARQGGSRI